MRFDIGLTLAVLSAIFAGVAFWPWLSIRARRAILRFVDDVRFVPFIILALAGVLYTLSRY